jgi:NarL family two-component system response regulator LiaR
MDNLSYFPKIAILLIEDHPLTRHGLVTCLEDTGCFFVAGTAASLEEGRRYVAENAGSLPDLIILDILLETENGLEFIGFLKTFCKSRRAAMPAVLVCSMFEDPFRVRTALRMGARGYIAKSAGEEELLGAIETVLTGGEYINPRLKLKIDQASDVYAKFTRREREVLIRVKQNHSNQRIARELDISQRTVENHLSHIYLKAGCFTRQELMDI